MLGGGEMGAEKSRREGWRRRRGCVGVEDDREEVPVLGKEISKDWGDDTGGGGGER